MNAYNYKMIGFNLNMSSLNAAVGLAQMKRFNEIQKKKKLINKFYSRNLSPIKLFRCKFLWGNYLPWMNFYLAKNKREKKLQLIF